MDNRKRIYLDIDGVLLTTKQTKPAEDSLLFIKFIIEQFDCYWLTTHCKGEVNNTINYLSRYFEGEVLQQLNLVKPTTWTTLKTEAIDLSQDFIWIEDYPFESEKKVLLTHNRMENLIVVDLNNGGELKRVMGILANHI